jgi:O-antigen ligase
MILRYLFFAFCLLLPLVFNTQNLDSQFEFAKYIFSGIFISLFSAVFFVRLVKKSPEEIVVSKLFAVLAGIVAVNFISYLVSVNPHLSFWGDSLLPSDSMSSVLLFTLLALFFEQEVKNSRVVGKILIATLFVEVSYGLLQLSGYDFYRWGYSNPLFGTFGSTVAYSTYAGALLPMGIFYYFNSSKRFQQLAWLIFVIVANYVILSTGSRTPSAVNFVIQFVAAGYFLKFRKTEFFKPALLLLLSVLVVHGWFAVRPATNESLKSKFESAQLQKGFTARKLVWKDGVSAWMERPLLGYGPETFAIAQRAHHSPELNQTVYWFAPWVKAHNQLVQYLVNTGLAGLGLHLFLLVLVLQESIKLTRGRSYSEAEGFRFVLCAGFIFLFFVNLTGFNFVTTEFLYYLLPVLIATGVADYIRIPLGNLKKIYKAVLLLSVLGLLVLGYRFIRHYKGEVLYQMSYAGLNAKNYQMASELAAESRNANDDEPGIYCHQAQTVTNALTDDRGLIDQSHKSQLLQIIADDLSECTERAKNREHYFMQAANQYAQLYENGLLPTPQKSLENFEIVTSLAPNVPIAYFRMGLLQLKSGDTENFERNLKKALELKNNYLPAYAEFFRYYYRIKNIVAVNDLVGKFEGTPCPTELQGTVKLLIALSEENKDDRARKVFENKLGVCNLAAQ